MKTTPQFFNLELFYLSKYNLFEAQFFCLKRLTCTPKNTVNTILFYPHISQS